MSTLLDNATSFLRERLADNIGDSVSYTPLSTGVAETVNVQTEPYERSDETQEDSRWDQMETIITVVVGTEDGDVSAIGMGDSVTFNGFTWGVVRILSRSGPTGFARLSVVTQAKVTVGAPGSVQQAPGHPTGGRFDVRGGS